MDAQAGRATKRIKRSRSTTVSACPSLPDEIVEDILSRLAVKLLRRFQCVSRWFHATISSRVFQDAHFFQRNRGKNLRLFIRPIGHGQTFYACQWQPCSSRPSCSPVEKIMSTATSTSRLPQGSFFPITTKSCHGLLLLKNIEYKRHYVWNPSTPEIFALPDSKPLMAAGTRHSTDPLVSYGLGYCSATHRHRVVRMYCCVGDSGGSSAKTAICEVFALNESLYWRPAAMRQPPHLPRQSWRQGGVFCNGNLHFTFKLPVSWSWNRDEEVENICDIWLLRQSSWVWEKLYSIDWANMFPDEHSYLQSSWIAPLYMFSDKKIMFTTGPGDVFIFDPSVRALEFIFSPWSPVNIAREHPRSCKHVPTVGLFQESLALVGNASRKMLSSQPSAVQAWSEVLSRLPARMVGRLNQVCRGWRSSSRRIYAMRTKTESPR